MNPLTASTLLSTHTLATRRAKKPIPPPEPPHPQRTVPAKLVAPTRRLRSAHTDLPPVPKSPNATQSHSDSSYDFPTHETANSNQSLSDSSDDYTPITTSRHNMTETKLAGIQHPIMSRPPILTDGEITPKVVREFENHCTTYFINAKDGVADDIKVTKILGCFENALVDDWASTERERLSALNFTEFMKEFRERWLPPNWEQMVRTQMLGTPLNPRTQKFEAWAAQVLSHNVSLRNTNSHMTDEKLRMQLEIMLDEELRTLASESGVATITELRPWMNKIKEIDNRRQIDLKRMAHFFDESMMRAAKRPYNAPRLSDSNKAARNNYTRTNASSSTSTSSPTLYPPRLTDDERRLLHDHEGCLKCRVFYAGHRANTCTTILSGKDYKTRTLQDALRAKAIKNPTRATPVASILETTTENQSPAKNLVAAIFPHSISNDAEEELSDSSDTDFTSVTF